MKIKTASLALSLFLLATPQKAQAAPSCLAGAEAIALEVASVQQQLMVAGLICGYAVRYNRFVLSHRPELQTSDAALLAFFMRHGGEARYHSFKTRLANIAALESARTRGRFCREAEQAFDEARDEGTLADLVGRPEPLAYHLPYRVCGLASAPMEISFKRPRAHAHHHHAHHRRAVI